MPNDSSTGGYLVPASTAPLNDDALVDFMGDVVAAITGLNRDTAVLPRWQPEPPNLPPAGTDWVAVGVTIQTGSTFPAVVHDGTGEGSDTLLNWEAFDVLCSFYGPNSDGNAAFWRDGLFIAQNRAVLRSVGYAVVSLGALTRAPVLLKAKWTGKTDITVTFNREISRIYPVLNLLSAAGAVSDGTASSGFDTANQP